MTDRELLELAAKACGIDGAFGVASDDYYYDGNVEGILTTLPDGESYVWNPLTDDGDAFRLMVKLGLLVDVWLQQKVCIASNQGEELVDARVEFGADPYAATRRAIVRAAAEIGRSMK